MGNQKVAILHTAARLVTCVRRNEHIMPTLRDVLYWLPVKHRITGPAWQKARSPNLDFSAVLWCTLADRKPGRDELVAVS